ncbi:MAG: DivIVA domain-containing protein, partial [Ruminiclostridium sp.]|nr:DivIVA domain-containing protein [Ruminiclostridium sp.]
MSFAQRTEDKPMDSNSIMDRSFTEAMRGYKKEEVEEFLADVA